MFAGRQPLATRTNFCNETVKSGYNKVMSRKMRLLRFMSVPPYRLEFMDSAVLRLISIDCNTHAPRKRETTHNSEESDRNDDKADERTLEADSDHGATLTKIALSMKMKMTLGTRLEQRKTTKNRRTNTN